MAECSKNSFSHDVNICQKRNKTKTDNLTKRSLSYLIPTAMSPSTDLKTVIGKAQTLPKFAKYLDFTLLPSPLWLKQCVLQTVQ